MKNRDYEAEITYNGKIGNSSYWIRASNTFAHNVIVFKTRSKDPLPTKIAQVKAVRKVTV